MSSKIGSGKPYKVVENSILGRHLVATRDISSGESIIDEMPLVTGPVVWDNFALVEENLVNVETSLCLVCCMRSSPSHCCALCGLKLCSEHCARNEMHFLQECKIVQNLRNRLSPENINLPSNKVLHNFILTLRCLYLYKTADPKWSQLQSLQSSVEELEKVGTFSEISDLFALLRWEDFGDILNPDHNSSNDLLKLGKHCLGAMIMNGFSLRNRQGLYFLSSLMSHSCIMNTDRQIEAQTGRMVTRAGRQIRAGEPITTSYITTLEGNHVRWKELRKGWMFSCRCDRCLSSNHEMGTYLSTLKCPNCNELSLCPSVCPIGDGLSWSCVSGTGSGCGYQMVQTDQEDKSVSLSSLLKLLELVEESRPKNLQSFNEVEEWLDKYCDDSREGQIHKDHSIFIQVKLYLAQGYGRGLEDGVGSLDDGRLRRKLNYCKDVLRVVEKLYNEVYGVKGVLLFEMWSCLIEIRQRKQSNKGKEDADQFEDVEICNKNLAMIRNDAVEILKYSFPNSPEASMLQVMEDHADN